MDYDNVLCSLVSWAKNIDNVRCIVLTGSAGSGAAHPLSDRDLEIHLRDSAILESDDSWWESFGDVLAVERLENSNGQPTRIVYYVGGKLDFTLVDVGDERGIYDRPFTVLLDKDGEAADFRTATQLLLPPDQVAFDECVNWAYAAALMIAKAIVRDEPWSAKFRDNDLKVELLRMIEWDHIVRYNGKRDVRYLGTRMRQWMDSDIQQKLEECWAHFDLRDSQRALYASLSLFSQVSSRIAASAGLTDFHHASIRLEIDRILATVSEDGSK